MNLATAVRDYQAARRRAAVEVVLSRLRGKSVDLLSFEEVSRKLKGLGRLKRGLFDIPLDAIVGSVGRYDDFTRSFLPLKEVDEQRWARVKVGVEGSIGLPPIEVYKIGESYFVSDGHHRVSVAREVGATHIQAYVIEVPTRVSIGPEVTPEELIVKEELTRFLERTRLDVLRPNSDFSVTCAGCARQLEEHIHVHRHYMGLEQKREIPFEEAACHWHDEVYCPIAEIIEARGVLESFPGRTTADLYLWISKHREELREDLGWGIDLEEAVTDLAEREGHRAGIGSRVLGELREAATPDSLESGPRPGTWRKGEVEPRRAEQLFPRVLAAVRGDGAGWQAVEWALEVAKRERGILRGLHVVPESADQEHEAIQRIREEFDSRCQAAGVAGELAIEQGTPADRIIERSRWADLLVVRLAHPPGEGPRARLGSGFRELIQRSGRPLLAVPRGMCAPKRALLAYDGSPRACEALFIAIYLRGVWDMELEVLTVEEPGRRSDRAQREAERFLAERGLSADFARERGKVGEAILGRAQASQADLILMGGYGRGPFTEIVLGSNVDVVLRGTSLPVLFCT